MKEKITDYSLEELKQMFDLYNVKWIVCWSDTSKDFFDQHPDYLTSAGKIDRFSILSGQPEHPPSFLRGAER